MSRTITDLSRALLAFVLALSAVSASAQIVLRDRVEVKPLPQSEAQSQQGPLALSITTAGYPTLSDDGIFYSVWVRLSAGFATCCQGHEGTHTTCHSPFSHGDALTFRGVGYDGTPFENQVHVLGALLADSSYVSEAIYPLGYDRWPYPNCATGMDGGWGTVFYNTHARGVTLYSGGSEWVEVGEVEDEVTVGASYTGRTMRLGQYYDYYSYYGQSFWSQRLTSVPYGDYPPQDKALCGEGSFYGTMFDLDLEPRYKAVAFDVQVEPAQLAPGQVATVTVTPIDSTGAPVGLPQRDRLAVAVYDTAGEHASSRGGGMVLLSNPTDVAPRGWNTGWPYVVSNEGQVFGVLAPPDSLAPESPEEVTVQAWGYSGTRNRHVVGETTLTLCPVGGCGDAFDVTVTPSVLGPGEEGVVSISVGPGIGPDDSVDLSLSDEAADIGRFIRLDGADAVSEEGASLASVPLAEVRAGRVRYVVGSEEAGPPSAASESGPVAAASVTASATTGDDSETTASVSSVSPPDAGSGLVRLPPVGVSVEASLVEDPSVRASSDVDVLPYAVELDVAPSAALIGDTVVGTVTVKRIESKGGLVVIPTVWDNLFFGPDSNVFLCAGDLAVDAETGESAFPPTFGPTSFLAGRTQINDASCISFRTSGWSVVGVHQADFKYTRPLAPGIPPGTQYSPTIYGGVAELVDGEYQWAAGAKPDGSATVLNGTRQIVVEVPDGVPTLEVEVLTPDDEWNITPAPAMPDVRFRARAFDVRDAQATTTFSWEFDVAYTMRSACGLNGRDVSVTIRGETEAVGSEWSEWSVPFDESSILAASFTGVNNGRGTTTECSDDFTSWQSVNGWTPLIPNASGANPDYVELDPNTDRSLSSPFVGTGLYTGRTTGRLFLGGNTAVRVRAVSGGQDIELEEPPNTPSILGTNPTVAEIRSEAGARTSHILTSFDRLAYRTQGFDVERELTAVFAHESHLRQFRDEVDHEDRPEWGDVCDNGQDIGYPCHNRVVAGYGLGQLDFVPPTELQMWNWRYGVEGSATHYIKNRRKLVGEVEVRSDVDLTQPEVYVRDSVNGNDDIDMSAFVFRAAWAKYNQRSNFDLWTFDGNGVPVRSTSSSGPKRADEAWGDYLRLPASN